MKISNSKKELAKIISENGGWKCRGNFAAQCRQDSAISFYMDKPMHNQGGLVYFGDYCGSRHDIYPNILLPNWHQTILSRAEYLHLYPAPDADGWIEWNGGERPVEVGALIDVKYRDLHVQLGSKVGDRSAVEMYATTHWENSGGAADIIAYRLHKPEQADPELCESVMLSIPEPEVKPTIEQLAADYRNKLDYADRKHDEADKAKVESDSALSELEKAIAAIGFAITPIGAVAKEHATPNWRNWVRGDEIKCKKTPPGAVKSIGLTGYVSEVCGDCVGVAFEHHIAFAVGCLIDECFEFVNRPAK